MPDLRRKLFSRIVVYQAGQVLSGDVLEDTGTGSILDLSSREILSNTIFSSSEERTETADGSTTVVTRNNIIEIPLLDKEEARAALLMTRTGCDVQVIAIGPDGNTNIRWAEPSEMSVVDRSNGPLQFAPRVIRIESNVFYPDITHSTNLLENVPFEGTSAQAKSSRSVTNTSVEQGTNFLYGIDNQDGVLYELDISTSFDQDTPPERVTSFVGDYEYGEAGGTYRDSSKVYFMNSGGTEIYELDKATGSKTKISDVDSLEAEGLTIIPGGDFLLWNPGGGQFVRWDPSNADGNENTQAWPLSGEFSNAQSLTLRNETSNYYYVYVVDSSGNLREYELEIGSNLYTEVEVYFDDFEKASSKPGWDYWANVTGRVKQITRYQPTSTSFAEIDTRDLESYVLKQRGVGKRTGYEGDRYIPPNQNVSIDLNSDVSNLSSSESLTLEIIYPVPYTTIKLYGADGEISALDWNYNVISTSANEVSPTFDLSTITNPQDIWAIRITVDEVFQAPELIVLDSAPNSTLGVRLGEHVESCSERVASPNWPEINLTGENV